MDRGAVTRISGIALLSVMIVVAAVATTASWLLYSQNLDIHRTQRSIEREQAMLITLSGELWAREILLQDSVEDGEAAVDYCVEKKNEKGEEWSRPLSLTSLPILGELGNVEASLFIYDLQGFLNVNNLRAQSLDDDDDDKKVKYDDENPRGPEAWYAQRFRKLIDEAESAADDFLFEDKAAMLDSMRDWVDSDDEFRDNGAENAEYSFDSYQAANARIALPHELYMVNGFREEERERLAPVLKYLSALPKPGRPIGINVNTAPEEVLATLPYMDRNLARQLMTTIKEDPFLEMKDLRREFASLLSINEKDKNETRSLDWVDEYLSVNSRFFGLSMEVKFADAPAVAINSLLYRALGRSHQVEVLQRYFGENMHDGEGCDSPGMFSSSSDEEDENFDGYGEDSDEDSDEEQSPEDIL